MSGLLRFFSVQSLFGQSKSKNKMGLANKLLYTRLCLLTLYFVGHYILLSFDVWNHAAFQVAPPEPVFNLSEDSPGQHTQLQQFTQLVHPHVHGHPHLNVPLASAMRRCIGFAVLEWVALLRLTIIPNRHTRARLFGLLAALSLFLNLTGAWFGGLSTKAVLFPDLWDFIDTRLQVNVFAPQKSFDQIFRSVDTRRLPSVDTSQILYFLHPLNYLRPPADTVFVQNGISPLPFFTFPTLFFLHLSDTVGALLFVIAAYAFLQPLDLIYPATFLALLLGIASAFVTGIPKPNAGDHHWINFREAHLGRDFTLPDRRNPPALITKYITMSDGVEIAADIYLPASIMSQIVCTVPDSFYQRFYRTAFHLPPCSSHSAAPSHLKIPTYLMVTRYNRRMTVRWPFTFLSFWGQPKGEATTNVWSWQFVDTLVSNQYALVVADTRGTGASFGTRPVDLSPAELFDLGAIRDWLSHQFWFDGQLATGGFSYDGMTGLYLAALQPVQAVLALFTPINVVHDLIQPGGLVCSSFVEDYTGLTQAFELEGTPRRHLVNNLGYDASLVTGFTIVFGHAAPVKSRESALPVAVEQHKSNWNMSEMVESIHFTDDFVLLPTPVTITQPKGTVPNPFLSQRISANQFGITRHLVDRIVSRPVSIDHRDGAPRTAAIYIVGGYCDSSSVRGSVRLYEALKTAKTQFPQAPEQYRLTLGPWTHTGRRNCSPYATGGYSHFELDMYWDVLRFLDFHLKGKKWSAPETKSPHNTADSDNSRHSQAKASDRPAEYPNNVKKCLQNSPKTCGATVDDTLPVHFWSIGDEKWFGANVYPPENLTELNYDFNKASFTLSQNDLNQFVNITLQETKSANTTFLKNIKSRTLQRWRRMRVQAFTPRPPVGYGSRAWSLKLRQRQKNVSFHEAVEHTASATSRQPIFLQYSVDYNATTRGLSRWVIAKHPFRMAVYSQRQPYPSSTSTLSFPLLEASLAVWRHMYGVARTLWYESVISYLGWNWNLGRPSSSNLKNQQEHIISTGVLTAPTPLFSSLLLSCLPNVMKLLNPARRSTGELLTFTSDTLDQPLRVVGSPLVRFSINLTEEFTRRVQELRNDFVQDRSRIKVNELDPVPALDVTVFGYLEDVDPIQGQVHYVTEARMLLSHRPTIPDHATQSLTGLTDWTDCASRPLSEAFSKDTVTIRQKPRLGSADLVYQNGDRGSHRFTVGGTECIAFTFEPVTWFFQKGHRVRLSLAGADRGNFQWSRTQSKEDADLLAQSLLFAVKAGNHEWFNEIQKRPVRVERPKGWEIPLNNAQHTAFLKLAVFSEDGN